MLEASIFLSSSTRPYLLLLMAPEKTLTKSKQPNNITNYRLPISRGSQEPRLAACRRNSECSHDKGAAIADGPSEAPPLQLQTIVEVMPPTHPLIGCIANNFQSYVHLSKVFHQYGCSNTTNSRLIAGQSAAG